MSDPYYCYLDLPFGNEPVLTTVCSHQPVHKVYYSGIHQPCKIYLGGAIQENVTITIESILLGFIGRWTLTPEFNKLVVFKLPSKGDLGFFADDALTCTFESGESRVVKLLLIKIIVGNAQTDTDLEIGDSDIARDIRKVEHERTLESYPFGQEPPGLYFSYGS